MSRNKIVIAAVALVVIIIASVLGYSYYQQQLAQIQQKEALRSTLYIGTTFPVAFLDGTGFGMTDNLICAQIYQGLVANDPVTQQIVPVLAESLPTVSSDGLTYTFHIRKGITWHDGTPLTAQNILDSYLRMTTDPSLLANDVVFTVVDIKSTKVIDQYTLEFHLKQAFSLVLTLLASPLALPAKPGPSLDDMRKNDMYIGTGPWKFDHWTRDVEVVLTRNDNYWNKDAIPKMKTLVFKLYKDTSTMVLDLKAHTIDAAWPEFSATDLQDFKADSRFNVEPTVAGKNIHLIFSFKTSKILNDTRVRQAFAYAIDRQDIINRVYQGVTAKEQLSLVPPNFPEYYPAFQVYSYNPDKAKQLLAEAGYPNGIDVTITYSTARLGDNDVTVVLQSQLAKAGIRVTPRALERQAYTAAFLKGDFQILLGHFIYDYYAGIQYLIVFLANKELLGYWTPWTGYTNPQVDALVKTYLTTSDETQKSQIVKQLQEINAQDVASLPIATQLDHLVSWTTVKDLQLGNPFYFTDFAMVTKTA
jgi:peptide/nickel transport system substrate-binding protein